MRKAQAEGKGSSADVSNNLSGCTLSRRPICLLCVVGCCAILTVAFLSQARVVAGNAKPTYPQTNDTRGGILPTLQSVLNPSAAEIYGHGPLYIDAIKHPTRNLVYVVFNMMACRVLGRRLRDEEIRWLNLGASAACLALWNATWRCHWPGGSFDGHVNTINQEGRQGSGAALVVECPSDGIETRVALFNVSAHALSGNQLYRHDQLQVSLGEYFGTPTIQIAACTMIVKRSDVYQDLLPWIEHHFALGVERFLVYVEDRSLEFASQLLVKYISAGIVKLLQFWYGGLSNNRTFLTQWSQYHHCLYWARGRVKWLAYLDVDEYFVMTKKNNLSKLLARQDQQQISAVQAKSTFYGFTSDLAKQRALCSSSFPCNVECRGRGYPSNIRSKLIFNPEQVRYSTPHRVHTPAPGTHVYRGGDITLLHVRSHPSLYTRRRDSKSPCKHESKEIRGLATCKAFKARRKPRGKLVNQKCKPFGSGSQPLGSS